MMTEYLKNFLLARVSFNFEYSCSDCWGWKAGLRGGYGSISYRGRILSAHRVSYEAFRGEIPKGLVVMHSCDNRTCCNPDHLSLGTQSANTLDIFAKGRGGDVSLDKNPAASLTNEQVLELVTYKKIHTYLSNRALAEKYNVSPSVVDNILSGRRWRALTGIRPKKKFFDIKFLSQKMIENNATNQNKT